jgi:tRNA pseudouridine55 synthase
MSADGILIINKPAGLSSRAATTQAGRLLREKKAGHLGTLDPLATGVLPVAVGRATRLLRFLEAEDKEYRLHIRLGIVTDTQDAAGKVIARADDLVVNRQQIEALAPEFTGKLLQVPPMHSALKRQGQPLYRLARQGMEVERPARPITVFSLTLEEFSPPFLIIRVVCSPGSYMRTLAHDLGQRLGCGAHLAALTRLRSGPFTLEQAVDLADLDREKALARLIPLADCLPHFPAIELSPAEAGLVRDGGALLAPLGSALQPGQNCRLLRNQQLLAVAQAVVHGTTTLLKPLRVMRP